MTISSKATQLLDQMSTAITDLEERNTPTTLRNVRRVFTELALALAANAQELAKDKARLTAKAEFQLSWRSTGHWKTVHGYDELAAALNLRRGTLAVAMSHNKGHMQRLMQHPETGEEDVLDVVHTNRRPPWHAVTKAA